MSKMFAAVDGAGRFHFSTIHKSASRVRILDSDRKYGDARVKSVVMREYRGLVPSCSDLWDEHQIAFIWKNGDGTYWWDTLSLTESEARSWASDPVRSEQIGMRVVAVQFVLRDAYKLAA